MWVAGIQRFEGKLGLVFQDKDGVATRGTIEALTAELLPSGTSKLRTVIQFGMGTPVPVGDYLAAIGFPGLCAAGQRCYEFATADGPVVIPGQVLVVALVGATTFMRAPLLSPQGPTALMTAFEDGGIAIDATPKRMRQFQMERLSTVRRMQWVLTRPSARRAWASVYFNATKGLLDLTLPLANGNSGMRGVHSNGKFWVTCLDLMTLATDELPFEFVGSKPHDGGCWNLVTGTMAETQAELAKCETALPALNANQWADLKHRLSLLDVAVSLKFRTHSFREKVELVRAHLATEVSIYLLPGPPKLRRTTWAWVQRQKGLGRWPPIEAALRATL
jgi:hypothetical protein